MIKNIKKANHIRQNSFGFLMIEIIIAIALISIVFITLLGIGVLTLNVSGSIQKETQADFLTKEEFEALRNFRDGTVWATDGLGAVNTGAANPYYLTNNLGHWALVSGTETSGIFTRKIIFDKVSRDSVTHDIENAYNPTNDDSDTRKVTVIVMWLDKMSQVVSYLTNWKNE